MGIVRFLAAAAVLAVLPSASARAQQAGQKVQFGGTAGLSLPVGNYENAYNPGYSLSGYAEGIPEGVPVSFRGEVGYSGYSGKNGGASSNVLSFTANTSLAFDNRRWGPYVIGGIGLYRLPQFGGVGTQSAFGLNVGAGYRWRLQGMSSFVEVRLHSVSSIGTQTQFIPITFGLVF